MTLPSSGPLTFANIQTEFGGSNPIGLNEYYAGGGLVPAGTTGTYGAVPSSGQLSVRNFYGTSNYTPIYIEDVFSTYLYTGNSQPGNSSQYGYLVNNIDLLTKGGMIWTKDRSNNATGTNDNVIVDTVRGTGTWPNGISNSPYYLKTNTTAAQATGSDMIQGVTTTGYYIGGGNTGVDAINTLNNNYVSWTFRKQPKFFDVVTYTGNDAVRRQISHALGSVPGCIMVKCTSNAQDWFVNHRSLSGPNYGLNLNLTDAQYASQNWGNAGGVYPTSTDFTVGDNTNVAGRTYVAYLFAHNAGGFGLTGTDNVISCGSFTTNASGVATVTLGYEPQYILAKRTDQVSNWYELDVMRGLSNTDGVFLYPNSSSAESAYGAPVAIPTATGFTTTTSNAFGGSATWIYIAIRRGPMKVPTDATKVFKPISTPPGSLINVGFVPDFSITKQTDNGAGSSSPAYAGTRLQGNNPYLEMDETYGEGNFGWQWDAPSTKFTQTSIGTPVYSELFARAPKFCDVVCYSGTGSVFNLIYHNLAAVPELIITKRRDNIGTWYVGATVLGNYNSQDAYNLRLNAINPTQVDSVFANNSNWYTTAYYTGTNAAAINASGATYISYLFATCPGVSKVGSYTGTGSTQTINCGFTGGARFVWIKRTDDNGNWWYWDTTRGMVAGNDQRVATNTTTVQANGNAIYTATTGFQLLASPAVDINTSGGTYLYLAIA